MLFDILRMKGGLILKLGQLVKYNEKKNMEKVHLKLVPDPF